MKQQDQSGGATPRLVNNEAQSCYELHMDDQRAAQAQYRVEGGTVRFTHTEVDPAYEGQGLGSRLAAFALDDVKRRGLKVVPLCQFIAAYIARHQKEYADLLQ
jgi:hypothetical protein